MLKLSNITIYEDDDILVLNKPSGVLTIPDGFDSTKINLYHELKNIYQSIWVVHRLDKETSGILIFAKNQYSHRNLSLQFQNRQIHKNYYLLVHNTPPWSTITLENPLRINCGKKHRTIIDQKSGKPAQTSFRVIKKFTGFSLLIGSPHTGYTHQIRSHISFEGFPIYGDPLYTKASSSPEVSGLIEDKKFDLPINRLALHAYSIKLTHPKTSKESIYKANFPEDFLKTLFFLKDQENT